MRNLIKKILKESIENLDWFDDIPELSEAEKFIYDKLSECNLVGSKKQPGWTKYIDKNGDFLFLDNIDTGDQKPVLYVDYGKIWKKCQKMGVSYPEFQKICVNMLWETHKRKVSTVHFLRSLFKPWLWETHKRKVY